MLKSFLSSDERLWSKIKPGLKILAVCCYYSYYRTLTTSTYRQRQTMSGRDNDNSSQSDAASLFTSELCQWSESDDISEERLHQIIRSHKSATNNLHVSDYQFFHAACRNEQITEGIIQYLLKYFPEAVNEADDNGLLPLHYACKNKNVSLGIIQLLIDAAPDSVRREDISGNLPLHLLCTNEQLDETVALEILQLLLEKYPGSIRHAGHDVSIRHENNGGFLPIHAAIMSLKSSEFCRVLIDSYPGSERIAGPMGMLPFHYACMHNTVDIVKKLYDLYPNAIDRAAPAGLYPIHHAIRSVVNREANREAAVDIVKFLLDCDPRVKVQKSGAQGRCPQLLAACSYQYTDANIGAALEIIEAIYNAWPGVIGIYSGSDETISHPQVRAFVNSQLVYVRQARDEHVMTTPDDNGQLPLHTALQNNVLLGSTMILVRGNPGAVRTPDNEGALPLHIACMHHESATVVQYLIECDSTTLDAVDYDGDTILHYACYGANYEAISLLLEKYDAVSVSRRNDEGELPIDLLCESEVVDRESVDYMECLFRLLRAYPETVMNYI